MKNEAMISDELLDVIHTNNYDNKVLIWGASTKTNDIFNEFQKNGIKICGYVDRNCNREYNGLKVYDKSIITQDKYFVYIGLDGYYQEIIDFMNENDYEEFIDFWYPNRIVELDGTENYSDKYGTNYQIRRGTANRKFSLKMSGGSKCFIGKNTFIDNTVSISIFNNSTIMIGENCKLRKENKITAYFDSIIKIEDNCTFGNYLNMGIKSGELYIGNDCMFSEFITIRCLSGHNIFDIEKNINLDICSNKNIIIGKHVWIGMYSSIMGGTEIGDGSMIGTRSLVNKKFPNNSCIAGIPAKIIREKITWRREELPLYTSYEDFKEFDYTNEEN